MTKQKIVIQVAMPNDRSRSRAMALAAKANGVSSIRITGDLNDRLEVVGEGIDIVCLVTCLREKLCLVNCCLRKQLCHAEILLVEEVKEKKPEEEKKKPEEPKPCTCPAPCRRCAGYYHLPLPPTVVLCEEELPAGGCHVM